MNIDPVRADFAFPRPADVLSDGEQAAMAQPRSTRYAAGGKRAFDVVAAASLLVIASPLMLALAVLIRWRLGQGVLFCQQRTGKDGRPFTMYKFRTMLPDRRVAQVPYDGADRRQLVKDPCDPRHTRVGRLLRRTSLDELPQLVNVLRGDMSLVGPRPELTALSTAILSHPRHRVRPGMTGLWQISPLRFDAALRDGLQLDLEYVRNITLRGDVAILLRTVTALTRLSGS